MYDILSRLGTPGTTSYVELEGEGHFFEGVLTTPALISFYRNALGHVCLPALPETFSIVLANPSEMGSRGGLKVDFTIIPDQLGFIDIEKYPSRWELRTTNISCFHFLRNEFSKELPCKFMVDGQDLELSSKHDQNAAYFIIDSTGLWKVGACNSSEWIWIDVT